MVQESIMFDKLIQKQGDKMVHLFKLKSLGLIT